MEIGKHIALLLEDYNCVIVPGFGGFVINDKPAGYQSSKDRFSPPFKEIIFNSLLTNNDGLLANAMAAASNDQYDQIVVDIQKWVQRNLADIKSSGQLIITELGTLFYSDGNYRFDAFDKIKTSRVAFGLKEFRLPQLEVIKKVDGPEIIDVPVVPISAKPSGLKRVGLALPYVASILPILAYITWLSMSTNLFKSGEFVYGDLNPFTPKVCAEYKPREVYMPILEMPSMENKFAKLIDKAKFPTLELTFLDEEDPLFKVTPSIIVNLREGFAKPVSTFVASSKRSQFHIVAGCFGKLNNAKRLVKRLIKKGYSASIIDRKNKLYRVAFNSYATRQQAFEDLQEIKLSADKSAWLLRTF